MDKDAFELRAILADAGGSDPLEHEAQSAPALLRRGAEEHMQVRDAGKKHTSRLRQTRARVDEQPVRLKLRSHLMKKKMEWMPVPLAGRRIKVETSQLPEVIPFRTKISGWDDEHLPATRHRRPTACMVVVAELKLSERPLKQVVHDTP